MLFLVSLHPVSWLAAWVLLLSFPLSFSGSFLVGSLFLLILILMSVQTLRRSFVAMVWKMKWILFFASLIHLLMTPGFFIEGWFGQYYGITQEGLSNAAMVLCRLLWLLSMSVVLNAVLKQNGIMSALEVMLKCFPLSAAFRERLLVRLALTLSYAGSDRKDRLAIFNEKAQVDHMIEEIELPIIQLKLNDYLVLFASLILILVLATR